MVLTTDELEKGLEILKGGNWAAALQAIEYGGVKDKIVAGEDAVITASKMLALIFPFAGDVALAMLILKWMTIYGKPIEYTDPNYNAPAGNGNPTIGG